MRCPRCAHARCCPPPPSTAGSGSGVCRHSCCCGRPPPHPRRYRQYALADSVVLRNKPPRWNEALGAYCLSFGGRVTQASVKNFQLVAVDNMVGGWRGGGGELWGGGAGGCLPLAGMLTPGPPCLSRAAGARGAAVWQGVW